MICSKEVSAPAKKIKPNHRVPWITDFEDYITSNDQVEAICRKTRLEHNAQLDIHSNPKIARLTKIMVTLVEPHGTEGDMLWHKNFLKSGIQPTVHCYDLVLHHTYKYLQYVIAFRVMDKQYNEIVSIVYRLSSIVKVVRTVDSTVCVFLPFDLGVANSDPTAIVDMMMAGANIVRLNMSRQVEKWHAITVQSIRNAGNRMYEFTGEIYPVGVAMSLRGPEIRTGIFRGDQNSIGYAELKEDHAVKIVTNIVAKRAGCAACFWVSYPELPRVCRPGDKILIDRGVALLQVVCVRETDIVCRILKGGTVRDEALVQLLDSVVALPQLSETDEEHIQLTSFLECDFCIVNHARNEKMVEAVKTGFNEIGTLKICVIAKISSQQGLDSFDEILQVSDAILLDRASIEIEVGPEKLFLVEKVVVAKCVKAGKPVILSFHMSKGKAPGLDVNLIANAVLNGVDGIFLKTGEMDGKETSELIKNVDLVCRQAESARCRREMFDELICKIRTNLDPIQAVIIGAIETSINLNAAAIIVATTSGRSAVLLSTYRPRCPILAVTRYGAVARWLQLHYGIRPFHYRSKHSTDWNDDMDSRIQTGVDSLRTSGCIKVGDAVVIVSGCREGSGFTNSIRVAYVSPGHVENQVTNNFEPCW
ncbi:pyruvate kinase [Lasioglossum baleicum]|uniref:pyruvate kinase n=1 Tax=Lasioglossum baleicum TaxID=434251 RepID=UPI003FCEBFCD